MQRSISYGGILAGELLEILATVPEDAVVLMASDGECNQIAPLYQVMDGDILRPAHDYSATVITAGQLKEQVGKLNAKRLMHMANDGELNRIMPVGFYDPAMRLKAGWEQGDRFMPPFTYELDGRAAIVFIPLE